MPIATSRWASCSPSMPTPIPAATVIIIRPQSGATPIRTAPVAPVNPTWASAWPAKGRPAHKEVYPTPPRHDRHDGRRREGILHEVVFKHRREGSPRDPPGEPLHRGGGRRFLGRARRT